MVRHVIDYRDKEPWWCSFMMTIWSPVCIVLFSLTHVHQSDQENKIDISGSQRGSYSHLETLESRHMGKWEWQDLPYYHYHTQGQQYSELWEARVGCKRERIWSWFKKCTRVETMDLTLKLYMGLHAFLRIEKKCGRRGLSLGCT